MTGEHDHPAESEWKAPPVRERCPKCGELAPTSGRLRDNHMRRHRGKQRTEGA